VVICLERGADLHMAQLMPLPLTVSYFSKIQIGFTFLVPADPGSPGKRAVKMSVFLCVCNLVQLRKAGCAERPVAMCAGLIVCRAASASSRAGLAASSFSSAFALSICCSQKNAWTFPSNSKATGIKNFNGEICKKITEWKHLRYVLRPASFSKIMHQRG